CDYAMQHGEFADDIIKSAAHVAVILTQSWCPQWLMMRSWLNGFGKSDDVQIFYVEYDRETWFEDFMSFKENHFGNRSVPYIRYYAGGQCTDSTNFISRDGFEKRLKRGAH
ncbi:MAG: hypothetical protein KKI09_12970, partial [Spirochaetes bacterium]|nr:hypothetical protein [Spirochaetota bacterium]MBU0956334.1 hypothetical protein [Spirochaetota bacterium]